MSDQHSILSLKTCESGASYWHNEWVYVFKNYAMAMCKQSAKAVLSRERQSCGHGFLAHFFTSLVEPRHHTGHTGHTRQGQGFKASPWDLSLHTGEYWVRDPCSLLHRVQQGWIHSASVQWFRCHNSSYRPPERSGMKIMPMHRKKCKNDLQTNSAQLRPSTHPSRPRHTQPGRGSDHTLDGTGLLSTVSGLKESSEEKSIEQV